MGFDYIDKINRLRKRSKIKAMKYELNKCKEEKCQYKGRKIEKYTYLWYQNHKREEASKL